MFARRAGSVMLRWTAISISNFAMPSIVLHTVYGDDARRLRGLFMRSKRAEIEANVDEIAQFGELGEFLKLPSACSSVIILCLCLCTSTHADIMLMDEWNAGGASHSSKRNV
jgi:ABC-type polysaccharide/polyol phosphate transport system ATPase subunit